MKCFVPEISWHNRDPVYSVDIQCKLKEGQDFYRLASAGADCHVVIWYLREKGNSEESVSFECAADLQRHQKSVNCVRFSPNGTYLASGDDDGIIIIWRLKDEQDGPPLAGEDEQKDLEMWVSVKVLRGHLQDIYDLVWSPDSSMLLSGSIDNTAILWEALKGKNLGFLGEHKGFVQGVAWDPKNKFVATLATDRTLRVFDIGKKKLIARVTKSKFNSNNKESGEEKQGKLFYNDTLKSFFRRLTFSPNGEVLLTPCGLLEDELSNTSTDCSYIFTRNNFHRPAVHLPSPKQYTVAIRCCPVIFELRPNTPNLFDLPYRFIYAIATKNTVIFYDSQQTEPFGYVSNIHYTGLTDLSWSYDGRFITISSSEGYCSVISFEPGELGTVYVNLKEEEATPEKLKTPTKIQPDQDEDFQLISKEEQARRLISPKSSPGIHQLVNLTPSKAVLSPVTPRSGRRVELIQLSSPKSRREL